MPSSPPPEWWEIRPAQNRKPASYRCPLCDRMLPALSAHMLLFPEGDHSRRRHAHTACVLAARRRGQLPLKDEALRQASPPAGWRRLLKRLRGRSDAGS